ncbi:MULTISPECIES: 3-oxoacid CoA-transferase subunit B [Citromicrobium]|uniref:3-oxoacid CoA-transferase subunit B n=1 Tax=Citromicrobium TaxID=72173 RepID=UPI00067FADF3|nr:MULTISPECIES: 3-oxoacid CoA-transferase subunit B [Citromicrobium]ALG60443.1 succinyl-CoA:3-ketoacid-CoA transferase [Citromicrobium sp. JL477]
MAWTREEMAQRAALEICDGDYVNLGIGIPTLVANHIPDHITVSLHSENGMLGIGPFPFEGEADPDIINAGKQTVTELPTTSYFSSADSFALVRGGHIDLTILGSMQVSMNGDIANWTIPGKIVKGMGGAMDLVAGVPRIVVVMDHTSKDGAPKILKECTLPLTGRGAASRIITNLCVFDCNRNGGTGLTLIELAPDVTIADIEKQTEPPFVVGEQLATRSVAVSASHE